MSDTQNTHTPNQNDTRLKMFEEWYQEGTHPEEIRQIQGVPMSLTLSYREYYLERQNER